MFEFHETGIPECVEIRSKLFTDSRGRFVKTVHAGAFDKAGLRWDFAEQYFSVSHKDVIRGLHFQIPPHDHDKLVSCIHGEVLDIVIDLRVGSPTFGEHRSLLLSSMLANQIYIPSGLAHGFLTISDEATLVYNVTSVYSQDHDTGIHFSSADTSLPVKEPIVSDRDAALLHISKFKSPFVFNA